MEEETVTAQSPVAPSCPCGKPKDGHHHWDGYWEWCGRQQLVDALFGDR